MIKRFGWNDSFWFDDKGNFGNDEFEYVNPYNRHFKRNKNCYKTMYSNSGYKQSRYIGEDGYSHKFYFHQMMVTLFKGDIPSGMFIDHIDGNKNNNSIDNLEPVTPKMNAIRAVKNGLYNTTSEKRNQQAVINAEKSLIVNKRPTVVYYANGDIKEFKKSGESIGPEFRKGIQRVQYKGNIIRAGRDLMRNYGYIPKHISPIDPQDIRKYSNKKIVGISWDLKTKVYYDSFTEMMNDLGKSREQLMEYINYSDTAPNGFYYKIA